MKKRFVALFLAVCMLLTLLVPAAATEQKPNMVPNYEGYWRFVDNMEKTSFNPEKRLYLLVPDACGECGVWLERVSGLINEDLSAERCTEILANMVTLMNYQLEDAIVEQASVDTTKVLLDYTADLAGIGAGVLGTETLQKGADAVLKRIAATAGIAEGFLDFTVDTIENLELLVQLEGDYMMQYDFLETVYMYSQIPEMREAAQSLILANNKIMKYKLDTLASIGGSFAKFEAHDVFLDQVAGELFNDPDFLDTGTFPLLALSKVYSSCSAANLAFDVTIFLGDALFGTSDIYNRYNEILAMRDLRNALLSRVMANPALHQKDYDNMDRNISLMKMALYVDTRGEYCAYKMVTEDGKLLFRLSAGDNNNIEKNYQISLNIIRNTLETLDALYILEDLPPDTIEKQLAAVKVTEEGQLIKDYSLTYDGQGRICGIREQSFAGSSTPDSITVERYVYDSRGNLIRQEKETPHHTFVDEYIYDDAGKLISSTDQEIGGWSNSTYEYDSEGRLIRTTEESQDSTLVTEYVYNSEGILTEAKLTRDEYGRVSVHKRTYEYDSAKNLIKMVTAGSDGTEVETYEYDSQGRQIKIVLESSSGTIDRTFDYSCKPFVVCQYNGIDVALRLDNWFLDLGNAELYSDENGYLTTAEVSEGGRTYTFYYEGDMISSDDATQNNGTEELVSDAFSDYGIRNDGGVNNYRIPKINISGNAAEKTNATIYKDLYDGVYQQIKNRSGQCGSSGITYAWTESNGIVSILARWSLEDNTRHGPIYYKAYNASSETGAILSLEQLTQSYGLTVDEFYALAKERTEELFNQINGSLENADWAKSYYAEYKANMISDNNIRNAIPFISESGDLCIIAEVYYVGTMVHGEAPINLTGDSSPAVPEFSWVKPKDEPENAFSDVPQDTGITGEFFIGAVTAPSADAILISTPQELVEKITADPAGSYVLACDIDLGTYNGGDWIPLQEFTGILDGQGHVIRNLKVTGAVDAGLFLQVKKATFKNLGIEALTVGGLENAGVVAARGYATFHNCYILCPNITTGGVMGGLIGWGSSEGTELRDIYVDVSMSANIQAHYDSGVGETVLNCCAGGILGRGTVDAEHLVVNCNVSVTGQGQPTFGDIIIGGVLGNSDEARKLTIKDAEVNCTVSVKTPRFIEWKNTNSGRRSYKNVDVTAGGLIGEDTHSYGSGNYEYNNQVTISRCNVAVDMDLDVYGVVIAGGFMGNEQGVNKSGMVVTIEDSSLSGNIHALCNDGSYAQAGAVFGYHPKNMNDKKMIELSNTTVQCQVTVQGGFYFTYGGTVSGDGMTSISLKDCTIEVDLQVIAGSGEAYIDGELQ